MTFRNFGGMTQLEVVDGEDLARIDALDAARWAATSVPIRDLHCDSAFLAYVDGEGKGRIRVSQLIAARNWLFDRLSQRARMRDRISVLHLADLDLEHPPGKRLRSAAEHLLSQSGDKSQDGVLPLSLVREFRAGYMKTLANGDGIVCPEVIPEPEAAACVREIMAAVGSSVDLSGRPGVGQVEIDKFVARGRAFMDWKNRPKADPGIVPWGEDTAAAAGIVASLDAKVEELFWTCDLLRQEQIALEELRPSPDEIKALKAKTAAEVERYVTASPLAAPNPEGRLPLETAVNLAYQDAFNALKKTVLSRALGKGQTELSRTSWRKVRGVFDAYFAWQKEKPAEPFDKLDPARLSEYLAGGPTIERVRHFIGLDKAAGPELEQIADLEKAILYQRWLIDLVNNFVNFSAIYKPGEQALIDMGSMVIDGRRLEFCVKIDDRVAHKKVASESLMFLVYAAITDQDGKTPAFEVVAPVTSGERGRIRIGKRGIFIDVHGREWDATVVDVVENAISVAEAIRAPFRKAGAFISKKIEDLATSQLEKTEKSAESLGKTMSLDAAATSTTPAQAAPASPAPAPAPAPAAPLPGNMQNMLLIVPVAFGAITAAFGYILATFAKIKFSELFGAVLSIVGLIVIISGFLGWLRLRRRDMSLILEANGWAVNVHMKLTRRLGRVFTRTPPLPKGTRISRKDVLMTSAEKWRRARNVTVAVLSVLVLLGGLATGVYYLGLDFTTREFSVHTGWERVKPWIWPLSDDKEKEAKDKEEKAAKEAKEKEEKAAKEKADAGGK